MALTQVCSEKSQGLEKLLGDRRSGHLPAVLEDRLNHSCLQSWVRLLRREAGHPMGKHRHRFRIALLQAPYCFNRCREPAACHTWLREKLCPCAFISCV